MSRIKNKSAISCAVLDIEPTRTPFQGREKVVEEIKKKLFMMVFARMQISRRK